MTLPLRQLSIFRRTIYLGHLWPAPRLSSPPSALHDSAAAAAANQAFTQVLAQVLKGQLTEAPAANKTKPQDAAAAGANELSIKICSMGGSSLNAAAAQDAGIGGVKMSIANITNPALDNAIRLHTEGVEEPLADTRHQARIDRTRSPCCSCSV
jgi:hypothetical protein